MVARSDARLRAFVRRHTTLRAVADVPGVRLHVADDVTRLWHLTGLDGADPDPPLPYWAFAWSGGLALARHLLAHPREVAGLRVLDVGSGSGLCAIVAARAGAAVVHAVEIDPCAIQAIGLNARANRVRVSVSGHDPLDGPPPDCDVVLAGDVSYEEAMAGRMMDWLRLAAGSGSRVLIGDPGRTYLPGGLKRLATYRVSTSREIEEAKERLATVYEVLPDRPPPRRAAIAGLDSPVRINVD